MQTENKLNITAGEWEVKRITPKQFIIGIKGYGTDGNYRKDNNCGQIAQIHGWNGCEPSKVSDEDQSNAFLIADAGTTANKCGLLPSELLKQRDELKEALDNLTKEISLSRLNTKKDFSLLIAHTAATKVLQSTKQQ